VCPLLVQSPGGAPTCSVSADNVRPFWLRAMAFLGLGTLGAYLLIATLAFLFLKQRGYELTFATVAMPSRWSHFPEIQARLFFNKGREAYADGRLNEAVLALSLAYERSPENYEAGALLAWIWQASQPTLSNQIYLKLLRSHPERRTETAQRWYRILLNRGDFESIAQLSVEQLTASSSSTAAWLYALLFASHRMPDARLIEKAMERSSGFAPEVRDILALEQRLQSPDQGKAAASLLSIDPEATPTPLALFHRIDALIRLRHGKDALRLLSAHGDSLDERSRASLRLGALAAVGDTDGRRGEIERLLKSGTSLAVVEFVTANLIRFPEASLIQDYLALLEKRPLAVSSENFGAYAGLFCLAAISSDSTRTQVFAEVLRQISGSPLNFLDSIEHFFQGNAEDQRLTTCLSRLQSLPLEVIYALYERAGAKREAAGKGAP